MQVMLCTTDLRKTCCHFQQAWGDPIQKLLHYWSQLEHRTKQTIDLLQAAAEGRCALDAVGATGPPPARAERKKREKRKKALDALDELIERGAQEHGDTRMSVLSTVYEPFADLLLERAEMRRLWAKREDDHVFHEVDRSQRPLPVPFVFGVVVSEGKSERDGGTTSPMLGLPEDLRSIADNVKAWGRACASGDPNCLPSLLVIEDTRKKSASGEES